MALRFEEEFAYSVVTLMVQICVDNDNTKALRIERALPPSTLLKNGHFIFEVITNKH
jgi:hypothetical protein